MGLVSIEPLQTDSQLLDRYARRRDQCAFAELVERHAGRVRRVSRAILDDEHAVDEVVQDAFLLLARKSGIIPWHQSVGGWLAAAAYRLAHQRRCAAARRHSLERANPAAGTAVDPLARLEQRELQGALDDELNLLPARYRAPLVLCYLEGKTNRQAADLLGWPAGSIARRLARARQLLQRRLRLRGFVVAGLVGLIAALLFAFRAREPDVRSLMGRFQARPGQPDFETRLARLADGQGEADDDLLPLARQTAELAEQLARHGPRSWREPSEAMRRAAQELATAIEASDPRGAALAASRLRQTCVQCHRQARAEPRIAPRPAVLASQQQPRPADPCRAAALPPVRLPTLPARQVCVAAPRPISETGLSGTVVRARLSHPGERCSRPPLSAALRSAAIMKA